jgi:uracil-DNA glycosylase family protein
MAAAASNAESAIAATREEASGCTACDLYRDATQTVFGEGPPRAVLMFVGEAPGDHEDRQGRPFVGPAGQLLDRALAEAGIDRGTVYLTNAVKHFKFIRTGKRRLHQKPDTGEINACKPWLLRELDIVRPRLIVALGATAAQSLSGRAVTISRERGRFRPYPPDAQLYITVHPSYLLRLPDERAKRIEYGRFLDDLRAIREEAARAEAAGPTGAAHAAAPAQRSLF